MQDQTASDEIDLMALFFNLWRNKKTIALITLVCGVLALLGTLLMPSKWTTQAQVVEAKNFEIATLTQRSLDFANITSTAVPELNKQLYDTFLSELRSRDTRVDFFKQSELFKKLGAGKSEDRQAAILRSLTTKQLTVEWSDEKKQITFPTISFTAGNPQDAQQTLTQYLQYLNKQVLDLSDQDFQLKVQNTISTMQHKKDRLENNLSNAQKIKLENLTRALSAAQKADIREYARNQSGSKGGVPLFAMGDAEITLTDDQLSNNGFLFLLGQKYLQAQINSIKNTDPTYPIEYYNIQWQLPLLEKLAVPQDSALTDQSFHYQSAPFLPLSKDNPSRALVTLLGLMIGFMLACMYVLVRDAAKTYTAAQGKDQSTPAPTETA
ncbi:MAG: Wzz/FepE/Etk N-terminal domain-containing protein [Neisseria sp.]|nr:Wzz/FepE/Etk N-terminal domain-containing protein [Neisseria sp.]